MSEVRVSRPYRVDYIIIVIVVKLIMKKNKGSCCSSFQIILRGDYYIDLLKSFPCNSKDKFKKANRVVRPHRMY